MIEITAGNVGYDLEFTLLDNNDSPIVLTGGTIAFLAKKISDTYSVGGSATIVSAPNGTCKYTVQATDFLTAGQYIGEITVTWAGPKTITFGPIDIRVRSKQSVAPTP